MGEGLLNRRKDIGLEDQVPVLGKTATNRGFQVGIVGANGERVDEEDEKEHTRHEIDAAIGPSSISLELK